MGLELLGGMAGKVVGIIGFVAAILFAWWAKGKAGERKGLQKATDAAKEKEGKAYEDVARLRGGPGPGPWGDSVRKLEKPWEQSADPKRPDAPKG